MVHGRGIDVWHAGWFGHPEGKRGAGVGLKMTAGNEQGFRHCRGRSVSRRPGGVRPGAIATASPPSPFG